MLEICHEGLLERCKRPGGGHRRILSDPYPLGSSKLSSDKDERFKSPLEFDIYSLSQHGTLRCVYACCLIVSLLYTAP